jgi:hypothetical protein
MNLHMRNLINENSFRYYYGKITPWDCRSYLQGMIDCAEYMDSISPNEKLFYTDMNERLYEEFKSSDSDA